MLEAKVTKSDREICTKGERERASAEPEKEVNKLKPFADVSTSRLAWPGNYVRKIFFHSTENSVSSHCRIPEFFFSFGLTKNI